MEELYKTTMEIASPDQFMAIFGLKDENMQLLKEELGVEIFAHGSEVTISGEEEKAELCKEVLERLREIVQHPHPLRHRAGR